ncbi:MAG: hypothetical protein AAGL68_09945 [Pseudomonadota bacterium]
MSDYVWVSNVMNDSVLIVMASSDIAEENKDKAIAGLKALKSWYSVDPESLPKRIYLGEGKGTNLPPIFDVNGYYIVSGQIAEILVRYDLGGGALHPVQVLQSDKATPVGGDWHCWVFGNRKSAFSKQSSRNLEPFGTSEEWAEMPYDPADFDVAVTSAAKEGADVWLDPPMFKTIFLGKELGDELSAAGLGKAMRIYRATVV